MEHQAERHGVGAGVVHKRSDSAEAKVVAVCLSLFEFAEAPVAQHHDVFFGIS
jgi:hypothetical protein